MHVGPYLLTERLGRGTTGIVWAGRHQRTGRKIAIKIASRTVSSPSLRQLFVSEAHTLARLHHPNIIHIYDCGTVTPKEAREDLIAGQPWLVMERMSGETLQAIRGRRPWRELVPLLMRLLSALSHAHARGVLHLDLKPDNVLLGQKPDSLRLSDFGLAISQLPHNRSVAAPALSAGTPTYMAPEQIRRDWPLLGPWTDLYALGVMTWALAAGRAPFRGETDAVLTAHLEAALPPLPPHAAWAEGLDAWLRRATAKSPRARFRSAAEALAALPGRTPAPVVHRRRPWIGLSLAHQRKPALVGRGQELSQLSRLLSATQADGNARVAVIRGRAGTGKSHLAEAAATQAAELHGATFISAGHSQISSPHDGIAPALARHLRCVDLGGEALDNHLDVLLGVPADPANRRVRRELLRPASEPLEPIPRHDALAQILTQLGSVAVLVIDDVQWGLDAISFARHLMGQPVPVLIVLTAQEEALSGERIARAALRNLQGTEGCKTVSLAPLPTTMREALVDSVLTLSPALRAAVAQHCEGYPIYAVQLVRDWASRSMLRAGPEGFERVKGASLSLPASLAAVWQGTISQVLSVRPPSEGIALEVAAVLGRRVSRDEWVAICHQQGCTPSRELLELLIQRNLIRPRPGGFAFVHGMLRESLAQRAEAEGRLRQHHVAAARWLQAHGTPRDTERAAGHLIQARAFEHALELLQKAIALRRQRGEIDHCRVLLERYEKTLQDLRLPRHDRRWAAGLILRSRLEGTLGEIGHQIEAANALIERANQQGWVRERCLGQIALCAAYRRQGRYHLALELSAEVLRAARQLRDPPLFARAALAQGLCLKNRGRSQEATHLLEQAVMAARHSSEPPLLASVLLSYGYALLRGGQLDDAEPPIREAEALFTRENVTVGAANCANARGELLRLRGDILGAALAYRNAVEGHVGTAHLHVSRLNLCICLEQCGEPAAALEIINTSLPELRRLGWENLIGAAHTLALPCAAALKDWTTWDRHLQAAEDSLCISGFIDQDIETAAARGAQLAALAGQRARAARAQALARMQRLERR